jgi:hypothetical protein
LPLRQLIGSNSARQIIGSNFPKKYNWSKFLRKLLPALLWTHSRQLNGSKNAGNPAIYCFQFLEEYKYREFLGKFFEWRSPISLSIEIAHPNPHAHPSELLCCCVLLLQSNVRRFVLDESFFKVGRVAGAAKTVDVDRQIIYNSSRR